MTDKPNSILWVVDQDYTSMRPTFDLLDIIYGGLKVSHYEMPCEAKNAINSDEFFDLAVIDLAFSREDEMKLLKRRKLSREELALTQEGISDGESVINEFRQKYLTTPILCVTNFPTYRPENATLTVSEVTLGLDLEGTINKCIELQNQRNSSK